MNWTGPAHLHRRPCSRTAEARRRLPRRAAEKRGDLQVRRTRGAPSGDSGCSGTPGSEAARSIAHIPQGCNDGGDAPRAEIQPDTLHHGPAARHGRMQNRISIPMLEPNKRVKLDHLCGSIHARRRGMRRRFAADGETSSEGSLLRFTPPLWMSMHGLF